MRQMERQMALDAQSPHVINMGKLIEEHENKIRHTLNEIYFGKSRDIVNGLRSIAPLKDESAKRALAKELNKRLAEKPT
jgi:capping protein beta